MMQWRCERVTVAYASPLPVITLKPHRNSKQPLFFMLFLKKIRSFSHKSIISTIYLAKVIDVYFQIFSPQSFSSATLLNISKYCKLRQTILHVIINNSGTRFCHYQRLVASNLTLSP